MPAKGYRKHNPKNIDFHLRITPEEKSRWQRTADYYGYSSVSEMLRTLAEMLNGERVRLETLDEIKDIEIGEDIII